ncbi:fasciclin domain-containing protein [Modestobacter versicolor]|uniref:Putative surface protein with fasciclin (FAS1) repeats n=1 Tax=Modestobacter versicolor TaxID=429133 RepID=A0A839Y508_9ACTN|nr:fasciclin domain-containing protein [Modestobacter versicolor]MBB3677789.1 putative surface protein with fasciclin (FAS1) repeats [Modestobacter versicolor]
MKAARLSRATARLAVAAAVPLLLAGLTSCSSDDAGDPADAAGSSTPEGTAAPTSSSAPVAAGPFGPGCGLFPVEGPGSLAAIATTPAGAAISGVPELGTLTQAVIAANLVDVLNTRPEVTVLAPSNAAFDALGPDALPALLADAPRLTAVLTHHVLNGRLTPEQLVGEHTTLNGDSVTVSGPADAPTVTAEQTVPGTAAGAVLCGDVPTANATVYVVDQVLTPAG